MLSMLVCLVVAPVAAYTLIQCAKKVDSVSHIQQKLSDRDKRQRLSDTERRPKCATPTTQSTEDRTPAQSKETVKSKEGESKGPPSADNPAQWAQKILQTRCRAIAQEYSENLKTWAAPDMTSNAHMANALRNRYTDVICWDSTRVVLKGRGKNDYIHASWMTVPDRSTKYIGAQGPLTEYIDEFWCMIFQERTKFVVMLCNLAEGGAQKCAMYWSEKRGEAVKFGDYKITNVETRPDPVEGVKWTVLDVTFKGETFQVFHLLVTWWPDQLAPVDPAPMVALFKWVKKTNEKEHPVLVHCSAGVGRTATFVGIDYASQRIRENGNTNLQDIVKEMRAQRYQAIQSHVQYLYLHMCLLEYFVQEGMVTRDDKLKEFYAEYQRHAERKMVRRKAEEEGGN